MAEFLTVVQQIGQLQSKVVLPDMDHMHAPEDMDNVVQGTPKGNVTKGEQEISDNMAVMEVDEDDSTAAATKSTTNTDIQHTIAG